MPLSGGTVTGITQFNNNVTIWGVLSATGGTYFANTIYSTTSAISVVHVGEGPALYVGSIGTGDIASFYDLDENIEMLHIGGHDGDYPNVGIKTSTPNVDFTVNGEISASNTIWTPDGNSDLWNSTYKNQTNYLPLSGGTMTGKLVAAADLAASKLNIGNTIGGLVPTTLENGDLWITNNRLCHRSNSINNVNAVTNLANAFTAYQSIDVSTTLPVLRITQRGTGESLRVEDEPTPDSTAFIVGSAGTVGIGLSSLSGINTKLTVVGDISATGVIYASGGNSNKWNSIYTSVLNTSGNWDSVYSSVLNTSGNWDSVYTSVNTNSANWDSVYTSVKDTSANWDSVYTSVKDTSANWDSVYTSVKDTSANWDSVYTSVLNTSGNWDSVYTTYNKNSADYTKYDYVNNSFLPLSGGTVTGPVVMLSTLEVGSGNLTLNVDDDIVSVYGVLSSNSVVYANNGNSDLWNSVYTSVKDTSGNLNSVYTSVKETSGNWNSVYTSVNTNSANWDSVYTSVLNTSGNWDSVYSSVQSNSALYSTLNFVQNNFLPLTGGTITGNISATGFYYGDGSLLTGIVAGDSVATTLVRSNSGNWDSVYTSVNTNSANWDSVYTSVLNTSGNWDSVYSSVLYTSGNWDSVYSNTNKLSSFWTFDKNFKPLGNFIDFNGSVDFIGKIDSNAAGDILVFSSINLVHSKVYKFICGSWVQIGDTISGGAASINDAGDIVVTHLLSQEGPTRAYRFIDGSWQQLGQTIEENPWTTGYDLSLNSIGDTVAVGFRDYDNTTGQTKIYKFIDGSWEQLGQNINGEAVGDSSGCSVSLNSAGDIVAIGALYNDDNGIDSGQTRVYKFDNNSNSWGLLGQDMEGEAADDRSGCSVSINAKGDIVAIGAYFNDGNGPVSGQVRVYKHNNINNTWELLGEDIDGEISNDCLGYSVSLNAAGDIVAAGTPYSLVDNFGNGGIQVFKFIDNAWIKNSANTRGRGVNDKFGYVVSLNAAGDIIIGAGNIIDENNYANQIRVYTNNSNYIADSYKASIANPVITGLLTVVGKISANDTIYDSVGNSEQWNSIYTSVKDTSANWNSVYTSVLNTSANWDSVYTSVNTNSANWDSVYTSVVNTSGNWDSVYTSVKNTSGNWDSVYTSVVNTSGNWDSVYSTVLSNSATRWENSAIFQPNPQYIQSDETLSNATVNGTDFSNALFEKNADYEYINGDFTGGNGYSLIFDGGGYVGSDVDNKWAVIFNDSGIYRIIDTATSDGGTYPWDVTYYNIEVTRQEFPRLVGTALSVIAGEGNSIYAARADHTHPIPSTLEFGAISYSDLKFYQAGQDINGEAAGDLSGRSVSINAAGDIVAIGAVSNSGNGINSGHVRVYKFISGSWIQLGSDINGDAAGDSSGHSVSINAAGDIVAIGAIYNDGNGNNSGQVKIYKFISGSWIQLGSDINGDAAGDQFGHSVSINAEGNVVAIGAPYSDEIGNNSGLFKIYKFISGTWEQQDYLSGENAGDQSGYSVSLNESGDVIAVAAPLNDGNGSNSGHVQVFRNINGFWTQEGSDIDGEAEMDQSGSSVSINAAGDIVAIGAIYNSGNGSNSGHVRVYKFISGTWEQQGQDIDSKDIGEEIGFSVSINGEGNVLVIGSIQSGIIRVYNYISGSWIQQGKDIEGEKRDDYNGFSVSVNKKGNVFAVGAITNDGNGINSGHVRVYTNTLSYISESYKAPILNPTLSGVLTIVGNVSATGSYYGDGSKLTGIVAGDTVATTLVRSNSGNWDSVYTSVLNTSANWNSVYTSVSNTSANWNSVYTTVNNSSSKNVNTVDTIVGVTSAINIIVAVPVLPLNPNPNTLYIVI